MKTIIILIPFILINVSIELRVKEKRLRCFVDLEINEACVICQYITQKIDSIIDIDKSCPIPTNMILISTPSFKQYEHVQKIKIIHENIDRRRYHYPKETWLCVEKKIGALVKELCKNEISFSYQKYCNAIYNQFDSFIERYILHNNPLKICQNINMCPFSVTFDN